MTHVVGLVLEFNGFNYVANLGSSLRDSFLSSLDGIYHLGVDAGEWAGDERLHSLVEHICWRVLFEQQRFVLERGFMLSFGSDQLVKTDFLVMGVEHPVVLSAVEVADGSLLVTGVEREELIVLKNDVVDIGLGWLDRAEHIFRRANEALADSDDSLVGLFAEELDGWGS